MNSITISWPSTVLNPNKSVHGAIKGAARKRQREDAFWLAKAAKLVAPESDRIAVRLDFYPRDERTRDEDNMLGSMKGALDGVAKAIGVDDQRFKPNVTIHPADRTGRVVITVEAL
jgi:crossover junction endodeoxyribonuclease RusA